MTDLQIGQSLCDMHGKSSRCPPKELTDKFTINSAVALEGSAMRNLILQEVRAKTANGHWSHQNKMLHVIGEDMDGIVAAYSYDGRRGEIMHLTEKEPV